MRRFALLCFSVLMLAACAPQAQPSVTPEPTRSGPTSTVPPSATAPVTPTPEPGAEGAYPGAPLPTIRDDYFVGSGLCVACHANLVDEAGADVSIDAHWRASVEANAARDPFWQAAVRAAVINAPERREALEAECALCHTPMASFTLRARGEQVRLLDGGLLDPSHELHELALDGVSCTLCHQIREQGLGQPASYSGRYNIDAELPPGERLSFGPYDVEQVLAAQMQGISGFIPVQGLHVTRSEICASCHMYYIEGRGAADPIPIQTTYLEWFESSYRRRLTACQDCHMPDAVGGARIAVSSINPRSPFAQHTFVGGNVYLLELLASFAEPLGVPASSAELQASIDRSVALLQQDTLSLVLEDASVSGGRLRVDVVLENLAGHKLPSGFPSRRVWIHLVVRDANGGVVFESGAVNADGSIVGNDGDADPAAFEPHYLAIVDGGQVQIYEAVLRGAAGGLTTDIAQASGYVKDNRLLPAGLEKEDALPDLVPRGRAAEDEDFDQGGDRIEYAIELGGAPGPYTLTVEVLYQSIGYPWAMWLRSYDAPEPVRFASYYDVVPNLPVVIASETLELGP